MTQVYVLHFNFLRVKRTLIYNVSKHLTLTVWYGPTYQLKIMYKLFLVEVRLGNDLWVDSM